jgi:hypothetical protein
VLFQQYKRYITKERDLGKEVSVIKYSVYDEKYQLDATIVIYYHKYLYMFRAFICPYSGVQVVCYCIWCSALCVVAVVLRSRCVVLGARRMIEKKSTAVLLKMGI